MRTLFISLLLASLALSTNAAEPATSRVPAPDPNVNPTTPTLQSDTLRRPAAELVRQPAGATGALNCPASPHNTVALPAAPYDEARGDCALRGKGEAIEVWLTALENIAATCHARRAGYWSDTLASYDDLSEQIAQLPLAPEDTSLYMQAGCPIYPHDMEPGESADPMDPEGWHYTNWLKRIGENVVRYCGLIDALNAPMVKACDEISFYLDCQPTTEATKGSYQGLLNGKRNAAQIGYDYSDFFYTNTLQQYGWGNFRNYFNESAIRCEQQRPQMRTPSTPLLHKP